PRYSRRESPSMTTSSDRSPASGPTYPTIPHMTDRLTARAPSLRARAPQWVRVLRLHGDAAVALRRTRPRGMGKAPGEPSPQPRRERCGPTARAQRPHRPRGGPGGLPAALASADLLRLGHDPPAPHDVDLPRRAPAEVPLRH